MIQRDVLMRQVRQLTQALQEVLRLHRQGEVEEARHAVADALGQVAGWLDESGTRRALRQRPLEEVLWFCQRGDVFRPQLATGVADLLRAEGDLLRAQGDDAEAEKSYARALLLRRRAAREGAPRSLRAAAGASVGLEETVREDTLRCVEEALEKTQSPDQR